MNRPAASALAWPLAGVVYGVQKMGSDEYRYVGLTTKTIARRKSEHFTAAARGRKTPFADWLLVQPDREAAYFRSLEVVMGDDLDELGRAEERWIAKLRGEGHRLLNLTDGGLGPKGLQWTAEMREAARIRNTGRPGVSMPGPENPMWGRTHSDEQRRLWSQQRRGMNSGSANPNFGKFGSEHPSYGHTMSPEARERLAESRRGELNPNFGKTASPETRAKMSEVRKGRPMPSSVRSAHTRHHTNKGVSKDTCRHCQDDLGRLAQDEGH